VRVLVTGGAGYIGSVATYLLLEAGYEVTILDDCSTGHPDSVDSRATFVQESILEPQQIRRALADCDAVIHFAGKSLVGESVSKPDLYQQINVAGSANLLDAMLATGVKRIVFSSSAATYGEPTQSRITEDSPCSPTNPYGATKLAIDHMLTKRAPLEDLRAISLRYFNVAGALQGSNGWLRERHNPETHLIPNILRATADAPLKIFGTDWPTPDGTCIRDYVHVVDLIEAHIKALGVLPSASHEIINLGSGDGYSVKEVVDTASRVMGDEIPFLAQSRRAGDPAILVASIAKAEKSLGWHPTRNLETMINDAYQSSR